jgi:hypothetical protein
MIRHTLNCTINVNSVLNLKSVKIITFNEGFCDEIVYYADSRSIHKGIVVKKPSSYQLYSWTATILKLHSSTDPSLTHSTSMPYSRADCTQNQQRNNKIKLKFPKQHIRIYKLQRKHATLPRCRDVQWTQNNCELGKRHSKRGKKEGKSKGGARWPTVWACIV